MKSLDLSTRLILGFAAATVLGGCGMAQQAGEDAARAVLEKSKKEVKKSVTELGNVLSSGATLSGHDEKGRFLWSVGAKKIHLHDQQQDKDGKILKPRRAELADARATLYREGKPHSTFKAPKIELVYAPQGVLMTLSGGVMVRTPGTSPSENIKPQNKQAQKIQQTVAQRGVVELHSPLVNVDVKKRELRANNGIVMTQGQTRVEARQLFADSDLAVARVGGQVKATAPQGVITAPRATWKWKVGQMQADGGVTLVHDQTKLTGARLAADTNAQSGVLEGGAKAQSPQGQATASRVLYNWKDNSISARDGVWMQNSEGGTLRAARLDSDDKFSRVTASGDVTLQKDDQTLRASSVTAYDKFARAVAEGGVVLTRPDATLRAATAEAWIKEKRAVGRGVTVTRGDVTVRAGEAQVTNAGGDSAQIVATGDVRASNPQGNVRASRVTWGGGRVVGSGGVTLEKDGNSIRGDRLESDDKFQNATLLGDVNGRMANGQTVAAGIVHLRGDTLLAENGVSGRRGNVRLAASKLEATRNGRNVILTGGVTLRSDDGVVARAPEARYDRIAGKIYASGGVTISDPQRGEQRGRTLVADLNLKQATLTEVRGNFSEKLFQNRKLF